MKKPDLRIDTEFFDDNLNGLSIPQAIRVTQSVDTQTFIKEGLSDDSDQLAALSIQTIDRVVSQRLFDNFLSCWGRLKQLYAPSTPLNSSQGPLYNQLIMRNVTSHDEYVQLDNSEQRGILRQKVQLPQKASGSEVAWLDEKKREIRTKSVLKGWNTRRASPAEGHFQRAKVLKQIVDKLKQGRNAVTGLITQVETQRQNEQIHFKLNKLERMMEDVHYSSFQRNSSVSAKRVERVETPVVVDNSKEDVTLRVAQELALVRAEMERIRLENEKILKEEEWKKKELLRMAATREEIKQQYEGLKHQIDYLEWEKRQGQENNLRLQQQLAFHTSNRQQYQRQISTLVQRVGQAQQREQRREVLYRSVQRPLIPAQTNPFGYSTFATSQKNSQVGASWQQTGHPAPTNLGPIPQTRQSADEWACC